MGRFYYKHYLFTEKALKSKYLKSLNTTHKIDGVRWLNFIREFHVTATPAVVYIVRGTTSIFRFEPVQTTNKYQFEMFICIDAHTSTNCALTDEKKCNEEI